MNVVLTDELLGHLGEKYQKLSKWTKDNCFPTFEGYVETYLDFTNFHLNNGELMVHATWPDSL